jgi:hypothetical protein
MSHESIGWLKEDASTNVPSMFVTAVVFQQSNGSLNKPRSKKADIISVTSSVFQQLIAPSPFEAETIRACGQSASSLSRQAAINSRNPRPSTAGTTGRESVHSTAQLVGPASTSER